MTQSVEDNPRDGPSTVTREARIRPWTALTNPQFRLLWIGQVLGAFGQPMREVANQWVVWKLSGSALQLGLIGLFRLVPLILVSFVGGALADIVDRKKLLVVTQSVNLLMGGAMAVLAVTGNLQVWHVYAVTLGSASAMALDQPARVSLIPALVPRAHLLNAMTLNTVSRHGAMLVGPTLGGLLIAWKGVEVAYGINTLGFIPVIVALLLLRPPPVVRQGGRPRLNPSEMMEGLRFIWSTPIILSFILLDVAAMLFASYRSLLPIFADKVLGVGAAGFGALVSAPAFGFLIGTGILLLAGDIRRKGMVVLVSVLLYAVATGLFALSRSYLLSLLLIVAVGGFDSIGTVMRQTTLQLLVPDHIRGRATAVLHIFALGSPSAGQALIGSVAAVVGAPLALLGGSAVCLAAVSGVASRWREVITYRG